MTQSSPRRDAGSPRSISGAGSASGSSESASRSPSCGHSSRRPARRRSPPDPAMSDGPAALPLDRHVQLIACAGAGKTEAVSRRVIEQLELPGVRPEHVVAFTFNERAAAELKDRIALRWEERKGGREGLADLYVGTIHGFCLELLQQNHYEALPHRVLNDVQQRHLITRNSRRCGLADLDWNRYRDAGKYGELMAILREADIDDDALDGSVAEACLEKYLG